jgi:peptidoglycan/xylan/chitin deacetylase (PgdA/CDA1 family)
MHRRSQSLIVLGYHNVEGTACFPSTPGAGTRGLLQQFMALRKVANVVPLDEALQRMADGAPLPPRAVAITFDDGYRDNLTVAGPMLRDLGLPATCFLVPELLSGEVTPWWEELASALLHARSGAVEWAGSRLPLTSPEERRAAFRHLAPGLKEVSGAQRRRAVAELVSAADPAEPYRTDVQFLDWEGARRLQDYMTIGSHSLRHDVLSRESADDQETDILTARRRLQDELGAGIEVIAYPNGEAADYDERTMKAAELAGHTFGVTTEPGRNTATTPHFEIRRSVLLSERGVVELLKVVRDLIKHRPASQGAAQ